MNLQDYSKLNEETGEKYSHLHKIIVNSSYGSYLLQGFRSNNMSLDDIKYLFSV